MKRLIPYAGSERLELARVRRELLGQHKQAPIDHILDLWAEGYTRGEIVDKVGLVNGIPMRSESITAIIVKARAAGDSRAKSKRATKETDK